MAIGISAALDGPSRALHLRAFRSEVLANNIANADTPGYKARDFRFADALAAAGPAVVAPARTHPAHLGADRAGGARPIALAYRTPLQPSLDQNTVETHVEQAAFMDNAIRYQATLSLLNGRIRGLLAAITGQ